MSRPHATETVFTAVSHPIRRRLLDLLRERDRDVKHLAEEFDATLSTISQHLQILRHAGLVSQRREKRHRVYTLQSHGLSAIVDWLRPYHPHLSVGRGKARS